jgi:DNA topoisomerase-1
MDSKRNLVIVESSSKAKTIEKYLKLAPELNGHGTYQVVASLGHVVDLPPKEIGVDTDSWKIKYVSILGKGDTIKKLKSLVKGCHMVYLAADPDREGEAIAKNLYDILGLNSSNTRRVTFHEITQKAVVEALLNPRDIDMDLVDAQEARRILDRIVGYKLSPLLWRRFASSTLSAGRVQSVALRIAVDRANEIKTFEHKNTWTIEGSFVIGDENGTPTNTVLEGEPITDQKATECLMKELARKANIAKWNVSFQAKESKSNPSAPFTTSMLQQEAYTRHRIGAKSTMMLAQALYEAGHITYMRTDSTNLSEDAKTAIHTYIGKHFGKKYITPRVFKTKVANAQEAHECIRPTHMDTTTDKLPLTDKITSGHAKLYDLIWRRTVSSQMPPALYLELKTEITADPSEMPILNGRFFVGSARVLVEKGYLRVWQPEVEEQPEIAKTLRDKAKDTSDGDVHALPKAFQAIGDVSRPPSLFHEPSLVKALEKAGIGRPSTYASIIDKLFSKGYVSRGSNPKTIHSTVSYEANMETKKVSVKENTITVGGNETDRILPTSLGIRVIQYLEEVAPDTIDIDFTANMETKLDSISNRELEKKSMLNEFYDDFMCLLEKALDIQKEKSKKKNETNMGENEEKQDQRGELRPKNIIRQIGTDADIVQTKYGPALFVPSEKKFISITPFMEWKEKTIETLEQTDISFLKRLPIRIANNDPDKNPYEIAIGRYGLYVKQNEKNLSINKKIWDKIYHGDIVYEEIQDSIVQYPARPSNSSGQKWKPKSGQRQTWQKKKFGT